MNDTAEFKRLAEQYAATFHEDPPFGIYVPWPDMSDRLAMLRTAIQRGSPITDTDYPQIDANRVY